MSSRALVEIHDVLRVWIELRPPRKGELTWSVPEGSTPEEALALVLRERGNWACGEAGFGCRAFRDGMPEFEDTNEDEDEGRVRNIVVHVEHVQTTIPSQRTDLGDIP